MALMVGRTRKRKKNSMKPPNSFVQILLRGNEKDTEEAIAILKKHNVNFKVEDPIKPSEELVLVANTGTYKGLKGVQWYIQSRSYSKEYED